MWVRGLKQHYKLVALCVTMSHPMWVRGLKQINRENNQFAAESHPMWVRGLKHHKIRIQTSSFQSHPMWVRGLKLPEPGEGVGDLEVAPYVGAWIETSLFATIVAAEASRTLCGCVD